jgi:predicted negative regulator of RcsB-dependent stress response
MTKSSDEFNLATFLEQNRRTLVAGAIVLVAAGGGAWFWKSSQDLKETRALQALSQAERSYFSGNLQLAETELQRVVTRYGGTASGVRAKMLLAQAQYGQGSHQAGVETLRSVVATGPAKPYRSAIHALIAVGLEDLGQLDAAASAYADAAAAAVTTAGRDALKADQARVLMGSGKRAEALVIWKSLAADDNSPTAAEARLRVGELEATAASKS